METAEKPENQLRDAAEGSSRGQQQTEIALVDDGIKSNASLDAQIQDKKAFLDRKWMQSFKRRLHEEPGILEESEHNPSKFYIIRVPDGLRQLDEKAYTPQLVSIGPFHYDKGSTHLKAMAKHKRRYLNEIVARNGEDCLERFIAGIKLLEGIARSYYSEKIDLDSNSFVEMMVLDGCFIIELFRKTYKGEKDPILNLKGQRERLAIDLLKLENQIPLVILEHLYDLMDVYTPSLQQMALAFFNFFQPNYQKQCQFFFHAHLLDLLHSSFRPPLRMKTVSKKDHVKMTHAASELVRGGIKIKKGTADTFLRICFQKEKAVVEIPTFSAEENSVPVLFNLVALEHSDVFYSYFTEYIAFMDCLIGSAADVKFLCENGIIENKLGSNEQVAELFKNIASNITFHRDKFYLVNVVNDIDQCCGNGRQILRARLKRNRSLISCSCLSQSFFIPCVQLRVKK